MVIAWAVLGAAAHQDAPTRSQSRAKIPPYRSFRDACVRVPAVKGDFRTINIIVGSNDVVAYVTNSVLSTLTPFLLHFIIL